MDRFSSVKMSQEEFEERFPSGLDWDALTAVTDIRTMEDFDEHLKNSMLTAEACVVLKQVRKTTQEISKKIASRRGLRGELSEDTILSLKEAVDTLRTVCGERTDTNRKTLPFLSTTDVLWGYTQIKIVGDLKSKGKDWKLAWRSGPKHDDALLAAGAGKKHHTAGQGTEETSEGPDAAVGYDSDDDASDATSVDSFIPPSEFSSGDEYRPPSGRTAQGRQL